MPYIVFKLLHHAKKLFTLAWRLACYGKQHIRASYADAFRLVNFDERN